MKSILRTALFLFFNLLVSLHSHASTSDLLRWAADANSGAPFVFRDAENPDRIIGLDVDVINLVAAKLNMRAEFVQNNWDGLIPGLLAGNYDVVINGLEIMDDRKQTIAFSNPYYITSEQLVVHSTNNQIHTIQDLRGKRVATLPSSLAYRILEKIGGVDIKIYDEELNAYHDLEDNQRIDAVLLDASIAQYYAKPNPKLKYVDITFEDMFYGIGLRKNDLILREKINSALQELIRDGELKHVLEKWGLWNKATAEAWHLESTSTIPPTAYEDYLRSFAPKPPFLERLKQYVHLLPLLLKGAVATLEISVLAIILAVVLGFFIALTRIYAPKPISWMAATYVELVRGTPLLIQLYLIFYGLPHIGIRLPPLTAAIVGLGLNYAANEAENYRAGISSLPTSQIDAAYALGLSWFQTLRYVILPQAIRIVIPPVTNDFIALIKDSSLVSVITLVELTTVYNQLASTYFDYLGIGILAALMYFLVGLPFARLSLFLEERLSLSKKERAVSPSKKTITDYSVNTTTTHKNPLSTRAGI